MTAELIVPTRQVDDLLGIQTPAPVLSPLPDVTINLRRFTVTDPTSPAHGEWVDRRAVLRWMQAHNERAGGTPTLTRMISDYRQLMEL